MRRPDAGRRGVRPGPQPGSWADGGKAVAAQRLKFAGCHSARAIWFEWH